VAERSLRADPASFGGTSGATCWDAHLASSYGFDSPLFRRGVCEPLSSMRSAFHPLDRLGEGLLVAGLERVRVVGLVLESAQDLRRRAARVSRSGDLGPQVCGLHRARGSRRTVRGDVSRCRSRHGQACVEVVEVDSCRARTPVRA